MTETATQRRTGEITLARTIAAPQERVFAALTRAEALMQWWGPVGYTCPEATSEERPGGSFRLVMRAPDGGDTVLTGSYREYLPPSRLVLEQSALDDAGNAVIESLVTVDLVAQGEATALTLHARATVAAGMEMALAGMEAGWSQSLLRMQDVLTGAAARQIVLTRAIRAPRERVVAAFTTPGAVDGWWPSGGCDDADAPAQVSWVQTGTPGFRTVVTLDPMAEMTILTVRLSFATAADRDLIDAGSHDAALERLAAWAESGG